MNKNYFITLLVAIAVFFLFQMASWMFTPIHNSTFKGLPNQPDSMMSIMNGMEDGVYAIPYTDPNLSQEEQEKSHEAAKGKPWLLVTYHNTMPSSMTTQMVVGLILNIISIMLVMWFIGKMNLTSFVSKFIATFLFGVFLVLQSNLMSMNWWHTPAHFEVPEIIDNLLGWGLVGLVVGWLYRPHTTD